MEELLALWCENLSCRGVAITNEKITAQAFEIHRMLADLLVEPLPGYLFTSKWLKRFRERHCSSLVATQTSTVHRDESWLLLDEYLKSFEGDEEDVFSCGITNMYLNALPAKIFGSSQYGSPKRTSGDPSASVLLCCNANGSHKLEPRVLGMCTMYVLAIDQALIRNTYPNAYRTSVMNGNAQCDTEEEYLTARVDSAPQSNQRRRVS